MRGRDLVGRREEAHGVVIDMAGGRGRPDLERLAQQLVDRAGHQRLRQLPEVALRLGARATLITEVTECGLVLAGISGLGRRKASKISLASRTKPVSRKIYE